MITKEEVKAAITALAVANEEGAITPEYLGNVLDKLQQYAEAGLSSFVKSFEVITSISELPASPTDAQKTVAYVLGTKCYVYVGEDGDTASGKYQSIGFGTPTDTQVTEAVDDYMEEHPVEVVGAENVGYEKGSTTISGDKVADAITSLSADKLENGKVSYNSDSFEEGIFYLDGSVAPEDKSSSSSYKCKRFDIQKGKKYILSCKETNSSGARSFAITDSNRTITKVAAKDEGANKFEITPSVDGYLYINLPNSAAGLSAFSLTDEYTPEYFIQRIADNSEKISNINEETGKVIQSVVYNSDSLSSGYYQLDGSEIGKILENESYMCGKFPIIKGETYILNNASINSSGARIWAMIDTNGIIISVADRNIEATNLQLTASTNGYIVVDVKAASMATFSLKLKQYDSNSINEILLRSIEVDAEVNPEDTPSENNLVKDGGYLAIFQTMGMVGDSLASGEMAYNNSTGESTTFYRDMYQFAWIAFLGRAIGANYKNFSQGGASTRTFLEDTGGHLTDLKKSENYCQAYFIALTHNDYNYCRANWQTLGYDSLDACITAYIGTPSDIDVSNYNNNADTFYGNYAKIIQIIHEIVPHAKVFPVCTMSNDASSYGKFNVAVRYMATLFNNINIVDVGQYFSELPNWHYTEGHGNAMGYLAYSQRIATIADWIIRNNRDIFKYTSLINTDIAEFIPNSADASIPSTYE